jgi:tetratricopeptide (TPR) repeat protein
MAIETTTPEDEVQDRRSMLEAAFEEHSAEPSETNKTTTEEPKGGHVEPKEGGLEADKPADSDVPNDATGSKSTQSKEEPEKVFNAEKAPQAWKPAQKAKWDKLDPDIRQEVLRREREITQGLNVSAQARQLADKFTQTVQPYMARIQSYNVEPLHAINELLKADHFLSTAPKVTRAQFMAKLISDYDIDLVELDGALSGKGPADPVESRVEQMLAQRLAPIQQYLTNQQQAEQFRQQQIGQQLEQTVETMAQDPKYPYFEQVRESMADIVELLANRGQHITLIEAYNRAIAMDPSVSQEIATRTASEARATQAAKQNSRAQRALQASVSVGGNPGGLINGSPSTTDRRATIAAAFDQTEGR